MVMEGIAPLALIVGVARAVFFARVRDQFATGMLSPSEEDVARLMLKGFDIAEIAEVRRTAQGTVRAQLSSIYRTPGHASRGRFVSAFLDGLIDRPDTTDAPQP